MKLPTEAWVMILDGEKYILLRNHGDEDILDLRVITHAEADNPPTREQAADRPGRMNDAGAQGAKSAVQETDWHALEKERFARDVTNRLRDWAMRNRFEKLVIVADPSSLGAMRPHYHKTVSDRIVAEIDKDLTNLPMDEIEKVLGRA